MRSLAVHSFQQFPASVIDGGDIFQIDFDLFAGSLYRPPRAFQFGHPGAADLASGFNPPLRCSLANRDA